MKKYLAILMAVILVMALVIGCAPDNNQQNETPQNENPAEDNMNVPGDMEDPGEIEGPGDNNPSGNDQDLDNPTDTEGTPSGSIKLNYLF